MEARSRRQENGIDLWPQWTVTIKTCRMFHFARPEKRIAEIVFRNWLTF
jgi:hypothetical protein